MALHAEPQGHLDLIAKATDHFDRIDFALNWMDAKEIKEINKELAAICKRHDIGKIVTDSEGNPRLSNLPSTEEVKSKSGKTKKGKSKDKSKTSNRNGDTMPTKTPELTKAEVRQYMEEHMIDMRGTFEKKAAYVAEHMVHHGKLVKKGLERLLALIEKHDIPFKDDRRKREEVRASIAADAILADGYVVEGKGIAKPGDDEDDAPVKSKKTSSSKSSKEDTKSSKKSTAKSTSTKRSRKDEDEDEEDDDEEEEKPKKSSKTSKVKTKEKTSTSKKRSRDEDEDEAPKKSSKLRSKRRSDDEDEAPRKKKTSSSSKSSSKDKVTSTKKKSRK